MHSWYKKTARSHIYWVEKEVQRRAERGNSGCGELWVGCRWRHVPGTIYTRTTPLRRSISFQRFALIRQERIKSDLRRFSNYPQTNRSPSTSVRRTPSIMLALNTQSIFPLCGFPQAPSHKTQNTHYPNYIRLQSVQLIDIHFQLAVAPETHFYIEYREKYIIANEKYG